MRQLQQQLCHFLRYPFFSDFRTLFCLWMLLPVVAALAKLHSYGNFLIFRYVFWHTIDQSSLYASYQEYADNNHYGPFFSLVIAPFAALPELAGLFLWLIALTLALYYAIRKLPLPDKKQIFIYWYCAHELLTALFMQQFNIAVVAIIIATFCFIEKEKDIWAAFMIMLATFVKLYGIVGLSFFFFSKHKIRFVVALVVWAVLMYLLPMLISSPDFINSQYVEWYHTLMRKNAQNSFSLMQNISLLGMIRKISQSGSYSDLCVLLPGLIVFALPYLRLSQYKNKAFRLTLLASVLMFVVLFSTGSESSSYIIAMTGVAIWYVAAPWKRSKWDVALLVFVFILTSFSPSDLFPAFIRKQYVIPYALKSLPCVLVWLKLSYEICRRDYGLPPDKEVPSQIP